MLLSCPDFQHAKGRLSGYVAVKGDIPRLLSLLSECSVRDLQIHTQTLEEIFLHYYGGEKA